MPLVDYVLAGISSKPVRPVSDNPTEPQSRPDRQTSSRLVALLILVPGLMGSLVCSLLLLAFFQLPGIRLLYDSWVPMLAGQTLAVLPKAALTAALLQKSFDGSVVHSATLLLSSNVRRVREAGSRIVWRLTTGRWLMAGFLVSQWCFWDVTVASLLRPIQLEPVVTRLYNEMHYGRTEALMSLAFLAALSPGLVWLIVTALSRLRASGRHHTTL
jgi:iron(III) transport system permease protein